MICRLILFGLLTSLLLQVHRILASEANEHVFTNSWAVQLDTSDVAVADDVATSFGFVSRGGIGSLPGFFEFIHERTPNRKKRSSEHHTRSLLNHPRVIWAKQQILLHRSKRDGHRETVASRAEQNKRFFNDPKWSEQWYLYDDGENNRRNLKVLDAVQLGYSGKGVVVSILDDGLDHAHPDLKQNYDSKASTDLNDNDNDPTPNATNPSNDHGTKCAGEVAAEANNNVCGVGVAYKASLGGIRMLDGPITDLTEAKALYFRHQYVDIKSASWGPMDDGKTFGKPEELAENALRMSAEKGRGGKGTIFVWATGNGGRSNDDCNCDGYTSSIYTLSIGSITPAGSSTYYGEMCPSTMAVVYTGDIGPNTSNFGRYDNLITTTLHNKCAESFSGTSCAAPLAAGIFALVLDANPHLTWRDLQHLVVETAEKNNPSSRTWQKNAAGKMYSRAYGFGVLNARSLVIRAKDWNQVGKQLKRTFPGPGGYRVIPSNGKQILQIKVSTPQQGHQPRITKLEHVQVVMSVTHRRRGDLEIKLESPGGTNSILLSRRPQDTSLNGLTDWPFTSLAFWGENPEGVWNLAVTDVQTQDILFDENSSQEGESEYPSGDNLADLQHGRFKEDYMKIASRSKKPKWLTSDESMCSQGFGAGCITQWTLIIYGTA